MFLYIYSVYKELFFFFVGKKKRKMELLLEQMVKIAKKKMRKDYLVCQRNDLNGMRLLGNFLTIM